MVQIVDMEMFIDLSIEIIIRFDPLMDQNIVCYKFNNLGHKARDCREMKEDNPMPNVCIPTTPWKRKEIPYNENCQIALVIEECKEEYEWFIDSWCIEGSKIPLTQQQEPNPPKRPN
jgi:hypothetical protein